MRATLTNGDTKHELVISFMHAPKVNIKTINALQEAAGNLVPASETFLKAFVNECLLGAKKLVPTRTTCLIKKFEAGKKGNELDILATGEARVNPEPCYFSGVPDQFVRRDGRVIALDKAIDNLVGCAAVEALTVEGAEVAPAAPAITGVDGFQVPEFREQIVQAYAAIHNYPTMTILDNPKYKLFRKYFFIRYNAGLEDNSRDIRVIRQFLAKRA